MQCCFRWLAILACCLTASGAWGAPHDLVPRGDWSYDVLASLALRGLLPGVSARSLHGDELRTRQEIAELIAPVAEQAPEVPARLRAMLWHLLREYRPELGERAATLLDRLEAPERGSAGGGYLMG